MDKNLSRESQEDS
jgi:nitrate/TMAO reductase-like tetraheme cytochrome c subunit